MAATVETRATSTETGNVTTHTITMPSGITSGDLLIVFMAVDGSAGGVTPPTGWTEISLSGSNSSVDEFFFWREADGTEGSTEDFTSGNSQKSGSIAFRISGAEDPDTTPPEVTTNSSSGNGSAADPPSLSPSGGSDDYLWIALVGASHQASPTAAPTNYSNLQTANSGGGGGAMAASAERTLTASSEDPGAFGSTALTSWDAYTVAIYPSAGGSAQTIDVNEFAESEAAQTVTVDAATSIEVVEFAEIETAQAVATNATASVSVGAATESEVAQAVAFTSEISVAVDEPTESEAAQLISVSSATDMAVTAPVESETAQTVVASTGGTVSIGSAAETEAAQTTTPVAGIVSVEVTEVVETEASQSINPVVSIAIGTATESESAQNIGSSSETSVSVSSATESESAQTVSLLETEPEFLVEAASYSETAFDIDLPKGPVVLDITTTTYEQFTAADPILVDYPSTVNAGDLLLLFVNSTGTGSLFHNPTGWAPVQNYPADDEELDGASRTDLSNYMKVADGTESGTFTAQAGGGTTSDGAWIFKIFRIANWDKETLPIKTYLESDENASAPSISRDWVTDETNLVIAAQTSNVLSSGAKFVGPPTGYNYFTWDEDGGQDIQMATAQKQTNASSEDPDAFEFEGSPPNMGIQYATVMIRGVYSAPRHPIVEDHVETLFTTASTTHNVDMPSIVEPDELLLLFFGRGIDQTASITTPTDWTRLDTLTSNDFGAAFYKIADGDEDGTTVDVATSASVKGIAHVYRIGFWFGNINGVEFSEIEQNDPWHPPDLTTSWDTRDNLWVISFSTTSATGTGDDISSPPPFPPVDYEDNFNWNKTGDTNLTDVQMGTAWSKRADQYGYFEFNPLFGEGFNFGQWQFSSGHSTTTSPLFTIAIRPPETIIDVEEVKERDEGIDVSFLSVFNADVATESDVAYDVVLGQPLNFDVDEATYSEIAFDVLLAITENAGLTIQGSLEFEATQAENLPAQPLQGLGVVGGSGPGAKLGSRTSPYARRIYKSNRRFVRR